MTGIAHSTLTDAELRAALVAVDPTVVLLPQRTLRRVIKYHRRLHVPGLQVPHRKCYRLDVDALKEFLTAEEWHTAFADQEPVAGSALILLPLPSPRTAQTLERPALLRKYWRLLFHARVHRELESMHQAGKLSVADVRKRCYGIGPTECAEIRSVLNQERFLLPPEAPESLYVEFAAVFFELRYFDPRLLPTCFPALSDADAVAALLGQDFDVDGLFRSTRPDGAATPGVELNHGMVGVAANAPLPTVDDSTPRGASQVVRRYAGNAERISRQGNDLAAALMIYQCLAHAAEDEKPGLVARLDAFLDHLCGRLQTALDLTDQQRQEWCASLPALLERASRGFWTSEARLLYDLQKVCVDHEKGLYAIDLLPWMFTLGRRPLRRPLSGLRDVRVVKHLHGALRRLEHAEIAADPRRALEKLLHDALASRDERLRSHFRPLLDTGLDDVGLRPANYPERLARAKLVEELLDRVSGQGFFNLGHLRDALSRNQLKLPDLQRAGEVLLADPLLKLNRAYASSLAGVYRPGEVYLRCLQSFSAMMFGTALGRWLTLFVLLPFVGAFVLIKGTQYMLEEVHVHWHPDLTMTLAGVLGGGIFLELLIHAPRFRLALWHGIHVSWRGLRFGFYDAPRWLFSHPALRALFEAGLGRYLLLPLSPAVPAGLLAGLWNRDPLVALQVAAAVFLVMTLIFNTRLGLDLFDFTADRLLLRWNWFLGDFIPGLLRLLMDLFRLLLDALERLLYTVDEWFRFRAGDSRVSLAAKAVFGQLWAVIRYIARIYINLFIEPTVNPIKHFPVVTVGAKLIIPYIKPMGEKLHEWSSPYVGDVVAYPLIVTTILLLPGIFGFIAWEFKENWRLYAANRAKTLRPVLVGSHGETVLRLLKPGFHSGPVPKLFARLRRAERRRDHKIAHKLRHELDHVAEAVRLFIERDFLWFLRESRCWDGLPVETVRLDLATNRIRVWLGMPPSPALPVALVFDLCGRRLVAAIVVEGWLEKLTASQRQVFRIALAGLYKKAGINIACEQVAAELGGSPALFALTPESLLAWPDAAMEPEIRYDLDQEPTLFPVPSEGFPTLGADKLFFDRVSLTWDEWVHAWSGEETGDGALGDFLPGVHLLGPQEPRPSGSVEPLPAP